MNAAKIEKVFPTDLLEEGYYVLTQLRERERCLNVAIAEGICGLTEGTSLNDAQRVLRDAVKQGWVDVERCGEKGGCFTTRDGATYIFPL